MSIAVRHLLPSRALRARRRSTRVPVIAPSVTVDPLLSQYHRHSFVHFTSPRPLVTGHGDTCRRGRRFLAAPFGGARETRTREKLRETSREDKRSSGQNCAIKSDDAGTSGEKHRAKARPADLVASPFCGCRIIDSNAKS